MTGKEGEQQPASVLERLKTINPQRNVAFTAVEELTDPNEMKQFMTEYTDWLATSDDLGVQVHADDVARSNMGYVTVYYGKEIIKRWQEVFEDLNHPVFGRDIPFGRPEEAYALGEASQELRDL